jgi:hypothetical protein
MKMKRCKECRKKLGIIEGYRHPVLGKDSLLCGDCFDIVYESVDNWREAILPYVDFFKNNSLNKESKTDKINILTRWLSIKKSI